MADPVKSSEAMDKGRESAASSAPGTGAATLAGLFQSEGLALPPVPAWAEAKLEARGAGVFSTRELPAAPYDLPAYLEELPSAADYLVIGFGGYGINSWFLHDYWVEGPLALFFQLAWGGALLDREHALGRIEGLFSFATRLRAAADAAQRAGKWPEGRRLVVVESDHGDSDWGWVTRGSAQEQEGAIDWQHSQTPAFAALMALRDL